MQIKLTTVSLDDLKARKKAELSAKCNETICGGFSSSALGAAHTYPSDGEAQRNFHSELDRLQYDPSYTVSNFKTLDAGYLPHTQAQLVQVFIDGHKFGRDQIGKLNQLKSDIDTALTVPDLDNIIW